MVYTEAGWTNITYATFGIILYILSVMLLDFYFPVMEMGKKNNPRDKGAQNYNIQLLFTLFMALLPIPSQLLFSIDIPQLTIFIVFPSIVIYYTIRNMALNPEHIIRCNTNV